MLIKLNYEKIENRLSSHNIEFNKENKALKNLYELSKNPIEIIGENHKDEYSGQLIYNVKGYAVFESELEIID